MKTLDWGCKNSPNCGLSFDPMWGGYECSRPDCGTIGYLGLDKAGKAALYSHPDPARKSIKARR